MAENVAPGHAVSTVCRHSVKSTKSILQSLFYESEHLLEM